MLATRVIPVLLSRGKTLVKGTKFNAWRSVGVALQAAKVHAERHVDELIILDVAATPEGRPPDFAAIKELTRDCFCPLTVGGGIRTVEDIRKLLAAGCDKVAIGAASHDTGIIREAATKFGKQAIVVIVDYDADGYVMPNVSARSWCIEQQFWGAGEILLQAKERDGLMCGYDLEAIGIVSHAVDVPVIACGGCSGPRDMLLAIQAGASAVSAGALFAFTENTPASCSRYLAEHGIEVRVPA